jgi:hypothetical protein
LSIEINYLWFGISRRFHISLLQNTTFSKQKNSDNFMPEV